MIEYNNILLKQIACPQAIGEKEKTMTKQEHVNNLDEAMNWLNAYDYRVWDEISKRTERTAYRHDVKHFNLAEEYDYIIIASDHVLELATDSAYDVIQFVNEMIDCFNELQ